MKNIHPYHMKWKVYPQQKSKMSFILLEPPGGSRNLKFCLLNSMAKHGNQRRIWSDPDTLLLVSSWKIMFFYKNGIQQSPSVTKYGSLVAVVAFYQALNVSISIQAFQKLMKSEQLWLNDITFPPHISIGKNSSIQWKKSFLFRIGYSVWSTAT